MPIKSDLFSEESCCTDKLHGSGHGPGAADLTIRFFSERPKHLRSPRLDRTNRKESLRVWSAGIGCRQRSMLERSFTEGESPDVRESFPSKVTKDMAWRHLEKQP